MLVNRIRCFVVTNWNAWRCGTPRVVIRVVVIVGVIGALCWYLSDIDVSLLGARLASARLWPLVAACLFAFVHRWGRAACWRVLMAPRHGIPVARLFRYELAASAASAMTLAHGSLLRARALERRDHVPPDDTATAAMLEKILDGVAMQLLIAPVPWLVPGLPAWINQAIVISVAATIAAFVATLIAVRHVDPGRPATVLRRFLARARPLGDLRRTLAALTISILSWAADLVAVLAVLHAVGLPLSVGAAILVQTTLNLAVMVPSTPVQIGTVEVAALSALDLLQIGHEAALGFALVYHALQVVPLIAVALLLEKPLVLGREVDRSSELPAAPPILKRMKGHHVD